ncbi:MAG: hypothetical protein JG775_2592, partial [Defluviitaleaceae bacterium]|nr:hypothetical protein [Defluviitaleaceae bacterium]
RRSHLLVLPKYKRNTEIIFGKKIIKKGTKQKT